MAWDIQDWDDVPATVAFKLRHLRHVFLAFRGLADAAAAGKTVEWTRQYPDAWDLVSGIMARQRGIE